METPRPADCEPEDCALIHGERRSLDRHLRVSLEAMHNSHVILTQQVMALAVAQERQAKEFAGMREAMPQMIESGFAAGIRSVVQDPDLMQTAGRGMLSALSDIGTRATGNVVLGWLKGAIGKLLPVGLVLLIALWVGGPSLAAKVGAWIVKTFGTTGG